MGESNSLQDGAEYDRRGNRKKYQKPGYNLDRRTYEVDDGSDRLEQQVPLNEVSFSRNLSASSTAFDLPPPSSVRT